MLYVIAVSQKLVAVRRHQSVRLPPEGGDREDIPRHGRVLVRKHVVAPRPSRDERNAAVLVVPMKVVHRVVRAQFSVRQIDSPSMRRHLKIKAVVDPFFGAWGETQI